MSPYSTLTVSRDAAIWAVGKIVSRGMSNQQIEEILDREVEGRLFNVLTTWEDPGPDDEIFRSLF